VRLGAALWKFWYVRGHITEGAGWLEEAFALPGTSPPGTRVDALYAAAWFAHLRGEHDRADAHGEEALALAREAADPLSSALALALVGARARHRGDLVEARQRYEAALANAREAGQTHFVAMFAQDVAGTATRQGDHARAAALYEEALTIWRGRADPWAVGVALLGVGDAALAGSDFARAAETFREALVLFEEHGDRAMVAACLFGLARVAALGGEPARGARLFGAAEALYEAAGIRFPPSDPAGFERAVASLRAALGEPAVVAAWAAGRELSLDEIVAEAGADIALSAGAANSGDVSPPAARHGLSPRELEVLRLIVTGETDRAIAAALFVSRRTVTSHVTSILVKLGVGSRSAAAAYAVRHRLA